MQEGGRLGPGEDRGVAANGPHPTHYDVWVRGPYDSWYLRPFAVLPKIGYRAKRSGTMRGGQVGRAAAGQSRGSRRRHRPSYPGRHHVSGRHLLGGHPRHVGSLAVPPAGGDGPVASGDGAVQLELRDVARGGAISLVGAAVAAILGFALTIVITRGLGAAGAGVFFAAVALFMILSNAGKLGADTGLLRMIPRYRALGRIQDVRSTLYVALLPVLVFGGLLAGAQLAYAPQLARAFVHGVDPADGVAYIRLFAPFLPLACVSAVALAGTRGFRTVVPFVNVENIGKPLARCLLVWVVIAAGLGSAAAIALAWALPVAAGFVIALMVLLRFLRHAEREDQPETASRPAQAPTRLRLLAGEFWGFAAPRGGGAIFQIAITWLDVLLVAALRSAREAGIYAAASRFITTGTLVLQAIRLAVAPQFSGMLAERRRKDAEAVHQVATSWAIAGSWPLYLSLAAFAPLVLRLFGPAFVAGQAALTIVALAMLVNMGTGNVQSVLLMGGKSSWNLINMVASLSVNVVLNLLLIPRYGINGAAIAWAASICVDNLASAAEVRFLLGVRTFSRRYLPLLLAAVACYGVLGALLRLRFGPSLAVFVLFGVIATVLYGLFLWRSRERLDLATLRDAARIRVGRSTRLPAGSIQQLDTSRATPR
jgi:O-antigen/teichoic acid export membrane protein